MMTFTINFTLILVFVFFTPTSLFFALLSDETSSAREQCVMIFIITKFIILIYAAAHMCREIVSAIPF
jgi:hypothetical protein